MDKLKATKTITNLEIVELLRKISAAYTILGENRFKIIAYDNAATAIEHATSELRNLFEEGLLDTVSGIGTSLKAHLTELFSTGKSRHFDEVLEKINPAVFPLLEIPGLGPKKAVKLVESLGIKSAQTCISELETACENGLVAKIEDFGEKSQKDILDNIARFKKGQIKEKRMSIATADVIADEVEIYLRRECPSLIHIDRLGSLRRRVATIGDLDFSVSTDNPAEVIDAFIKFPHLVEVIEKGPTGASILLALGRQVDLRVSDRAGYGAMLQYFTGSKYHNIRLREHALKMGYSLNEYGLKNVKDQKSKIKTFENEKDLYNFLGMDYIEPEMREDTGEIDRALKHELPRLIKPTEIKGDLHTHSDYDLQPSHDFGKHSMKEMIAAAQELNYEYFSFAEHNPKNSGLSKGEIVKILEKRKVHIEQLKASIKSVHILSLLEVDILPDGTLAVPDEGLELLDAAIVSIHSSFQMTKSEMTERALSGLSNPAAKILAHPTGRLIGQRDGYELDWDEVFKFCVKYDKALEINAHPNRLDLSDALARKAIEAGVKLVINTDSHNKDDLPNMRYGVDVARRAWVEAKSVVNTWPFEQLQKWLHKR